MIAWPWVVLAFYAGAIATVFVLGLCRAAARGDCERPSGDTGVA